MRNVFIELTNPVHGGLGWEFGECLWSPERNSSGGDSWAIMREPKKGDIIIHSYNTSSKPHIIQGFSIVDKECYVTNVEPKEAENWSGYDNYYRIELRNYTELENKKPLQSFLDAYYFKIKKYHENKKITGTFYDKNLKVAQKYLEKVDWEIFRFLVEFLNDANLNNLFEHNQKESYESNNHERIPERKKSIVQRKIRDTKVIQQLKEKYKNKCQICGKSIKIDKNTFYSEGAHIKPLGSPHNGSDTKDNIIILCPNHHVEFDYGLITIDHRNNMVSSISKNNTEKLNYNRDDINENYLKYHNKKIYRGKLK